MDGLFLAGAISLAFLVGVVAGLVWSMLVNGNDEEEDK